MLEILQIISPLFIIIFTTILLRKCSYIGDDWGSVLNQFVFKIGLPVLIFYSLIQTPFSLTEHSGVIFSNTIFILGSLGVFVIISRFLRLKQKTFATLFTCFAFSNIAYLGIPILTQVYGPSVLPVASIITSIYFILIFSIVVSYLDYSLNNDKKHVYRNIINNIVKNPLIIAAFLGLILGSLQVELPRTIIESLRLITISVTPLVMVIIGLSVDLSSVGKFQEWISPFLFSLITLIILPASFFGGLVLLKHAPSDFAESIIEAAMPLAITPFALADHYGLNKSFIAKSIILSTLLSAISLPFWISILL